MFIIQLLLSDLFLIIWTNLLLIISEDNSREKHYSVRI